MHIGNWIGMPDFMNGAAKKKAPAKKTGKKATKSETNGSLGSSPEALPATGPSDAAAKGKGDKANKRLSVERIYQKKSQLEHILLR